jgi:hypothetical protein
MAVQLASSNPSDSSSMKRRTAASLRFAEQGHDGVAEGEAPEEVSASDARSVLALRMSTTVTPICDPTKEVQPFRRILARPTATFGAPRIGGPVRYPLALPSGTDWRGRATPVRLVRVQPRRPRHRRSRCGAIAR